MSIDLAKLVVSMEANTAKFQKDMERVERRLDRLSKGASAASRVVKQAFAAIAAVGLTRLARDVNSFADSMGDNARAAGLSARSYQELRHAASQLDVEYGQLDSALTKFNKTLGDAKRGNKEAAKAFTDLGFDPAQFKDADEAFTAITRRLGQVEDEFVRASLQSALFGKAAGPKMAEFLSTSSTEVARLRNEAHELGLVMSDETIQAADQANKKFAALSTYIKTNLAVTFANLTPIISGATKALFDFMNAPKPLSAGEMEAQRKELDRLTRLRDNLERNAGTLTPEQLFDMTGQRTDAAALDAISQRIRGQMDLMQMTKRMAGQKPPGIVEDKPPRVPTEAELKAAAEHARLLEQTRREVMLLDDAEGEAAQMRALVNELYAKGKIPQDAYLAFLEEANQKLDDLGAKDVEEKLSIAAEQAVRNIQSFTASLVDAALAGEDMGDAIVAALRRIAAEMLTVQLLQSIGSAIGGPFGTALAGARADGGPVSGGKSYLVGERGPEIFTPTVSGTIIPNDEMGGMGELTVNVDARGADAQAAATFMRGSQALAQQIEARIAEGLSRGRYRVASA